jgi:enediyne biosynthesis protein E4
MYCQHPSRCPQFFESFKFLETSAPAGPHLHAPVRAIFFFSTLLLSISGCRRPETPLFTRLPPAETGISFANTIVENDSLNVLKFEYIYNGAGVGAGDFDADGLPDLFFAGNQVPGVLYLNRGRFKFEDVTRASGIETPYWSTGVAVADINDDGLPDVYLSTAHPDRRRSSPNQLFVNQGVQDGVPRFKELAATVGLADSSYATQAAFLDYDLDGDLDLYLLCNALEDYNRNNVRPKVTDGTARSNDRLYRNEGSQADGLPRFKDVSREAGINIEGWGLGVGVSDFNADGWPDIYCANDFLSNDLMWINNRDGTFSNRIGEYLKHQSHNSMGMDIADINVGYDARRQPAAKIYVPGTQF